MLVTAKVLDAFNWPDAVSVVTLEEALEINPPVRVERPLANKVEEALSGPDTDRWEFTVEEALDRKPPVIETKPVRVEVSVTVRVPPVLKFVPIVVAAVATNQTTNVERTTAVITAKYCCFLLNA